MRRLSTRRNSGGGEFELRQLEMLLKLSVDDFKAHARTLSSPDELSVYIVRQLMRQVAPSLLWITLHDIDIAHAGAYSLYIEGIRRTDRLCAELWKTIQSEPEYAGNTTLFILPDFGRDSDDDSGGNGFQHHRTGDALSRTTWMMALGARRSRRSRLRSPNGIHRPCANPRLDDGFFDFAGARQADSRAFVAAMLALDLKPEQFNGYPPEAKKLVVDNLGALQRLPLSFLSGLLREVIEYDFKFPAERRSLDKELANLGSLSPEQTQQWFRHSRRSACPRISNILTG